MSTVNSDILFNFFFLPSLPLARSFAALDEVKLMSICLFFTSIDEHGEDRKFVMPD